MEESAGEIGAPSKSEASAKPAAIQGEMGHPPQPGSEDVPDPDEDDLDDLDDMLDEFSSVKVASKEPEVAQVAAKPSAATDLDEPGAEDILSDDDFAKQLQAGMADLLGEIENNPAVSAQFESIFKELSASSDPSAAGVAPGVAGRGAGAGAGAAAAAGTEESFQETIRKTMERMQTSGDQATAAAEAEGAGLFEELMKQMQAEGGEGGEEEFSKMLLGMMEQLTNKEILYEPMKELSQKFPDWLETNRSKTPADDLKRYEEQEKLAKEIVAKFEEPTYSDSNAADREYIVDRMQKMQAAGSPPSDLVGDMPSAQDALNAPDESCNPQ